MKIERKYMAHYLNAAFGSGDASYTRLGSDLEQTVKSYRYQIVGLLLHNPLLQELQKQ